MKTVKAWVLKAGDASIKVLVQNCSALVSGIRRGGLRVLWLGFSALELLVGFCAQEVSRIGSHEL